MPVHEPSPIDELTDAARYGDLETVRSLVQGGVDLNALDRSDQTPLATAALYNQPEVAALLLEAGARIEAYSNRRGTALICAAQYASADLVRYLLEHGADVDAKDSYGLSATEYAAMNGRIANLEVLIAGGADVHRDGMSALRRAVKCGCTENVRILWEAGAASDASDEGLCLLLAFAVRHASIDVVRLLLRLGVRPDPAIAAFARQRGRRDVVVLLRSYPPPDQASGDGPSAAAP